MTPRPPLNGAPPQHGAAGAREALNVPGLLFIVFGALQVLLAIAAGALVIFMQDRGRSFGEILSDPTLDDQARALQLYTGPGRLFTNLLSLLVGALMVFGGANMRVLRSHGFALFTCALGLLPCASCWCLTVPLSVWAATILVRPEIKAEFSRAP